MLFYLIVIGITTIFAWLYSHVKATDKRIMYMILILFPTVISGLRGVGTDYNGYLQNYSALIDGTWKSADYKSILVQFIRISGKIGLDFQVPIFLISFLTIYIAFKVYREYEKDINFSLAVLSYMFMYFQTSFNLFRQMLAVEFFLLATMYLFKKNDKRMFWIWFIIASLIHNAVLPFGLIYFVRNIITKEKKRPLKQMLYIIVFIMIIILPLVAELFAKLAIHFQHYSWFLTRFEYTGVGFGIVRYIVLGIIPTLYYQKCTSLTYRNSSGTQFLGFYAIMGTILWLTSYISFSSLYRISHNLLIALPLLHGAVFKKITQRKNLVVWGTVIIIMFMFWVVDCFITNSGETIPFILFYR